MADPATAEILKPYYRYICKRPCFHDEYLPALNNPHVTVVDCPAGVERITEQGSVVDGQRVRGRLHRLRHRIRARADSPLPSGRPRGHRSWRAPSTEKWSDGASSLFGLMSRGFPNMFMMPAPTQQSVVTTNYTQLAVLGAEFIGGVGGAAQGARRGGVRRERRSRGGVGAEHRRHLRGHQRLHVRVHALTHQQRRPSRDDQTP